MYIKQISTKASRTFEVPGMQGKSKYVKIEMGAVAELLEDESPTTQYKELSTFVEKSLAYELNKLSKSIKKPDSAIKKQLYETNT